VLLILIISDVRGLYLSQRFYFCRATKTSPQQTKKLQFLNLRSLANLSIKFSIRHWTHSGTFYQKPQVLDNGILRENLTHISINTLSISGMEWCNLIRCLEALQAEEFTATVGVLQCKLTQPWSTLQKKLLHLSELRLPPLEQRYRLQPTSESCILLLTMLHYDRPNIAPNFLRISFLASPHLITLRLGRRHSTLDEADIFKVCNVRTKGVGRCASARGVNH
jgi:hypothetical protein